MLAFLILFLSAAISFAVFLGFTKIIAKANGEKFSFKSRFYFFCITLIAIAIYNHYGE